MAARLSSPTEAREAEASLLPAIRLKIIGIHWLSFAVFNLAR